MLSQKSIRFKFTLQLALASIMLIVIFSIMTYQIIKINTYQAQIDELLTKAEYMVQNKQEVINHANNNSLSQETSYITQINTNKTTYFIQSEQENNKTFLKIFYPYDIQNENKTFLVISKDITSITKIINQILFDITTVAVIMIILILFFAMFLSRILLSHLKILNKKLIKLDENFLKPLKPDDLPQEFSPIIKSINQLIERIQNFVLSQKELFIGIAHELKTPLAIMKSSNDVTLIKEREKQRYIDTIKECNNSIDRMNKMISAILQIGREEGAQFEEPQNIEIIQFLQKQSRNFVFLCSEGKTIQTNLAPNSLMLKIQPTLLTHILQNFVQNALKFSPANSMIFINSYIKDSYFIIEVIDNGCGIKEGLDIFAPFKRYGDKGGVGLGLFLAQSAAKAMKADISIKNKDDKSGCVATLKLKIKEEKDN